MDRQGQRRAGLENCLDGAPPAGHARVRYAGTNGRKAATKIAPLPQVFAQVQGTEKEMTEFSLDAPQRPSGGAGRVVFDDLPVVGRHRAAVQGIAERLHLRTAQQRHSAPSGGQGFRIVHVQARQTLGIGRHAVPRVTQQPAKLAVACRDQPRRWPPFALRKLVMHCQQAGADTVRQCRPGKAGDGGTRQRVSHAARRPRRSCPRSGPQYQCGRQDRPARRAARPENLPDALHNRQSTTHPSPPDGCPAW